MMFWIKMIYISKFIIGIIHPFYEVTREANSVAKNIYALIFSLDIQFIMPGISGAIRPLTIYL